MNSQVPIELVSDDNFQKNVVECSLPAIVVFEKNCWGTTQIMKPIIEKLASDYLNKIKIFKYDLDQNSETSEIYRIEDSISILAFKEGELLIKTGMTSKMELEKIINSFLLI